MVMVSCTEQEVKKKPVSFFLLFSSIPYTELLFAFGA